jgi:integrase
MAVPRALTLAAGCGLRRSEAAGLRRSDVDLSTGELRVRRGVHSLRRPEGGTVLIEQPPKSDRGTRSVEIPESVRRMLRAYVSAQDERRRRAAEAWAESWHVDDVLIHDGIGRPMRPDSLSQRRRKLRASVGVRPRYGCTTSARCT